MNKIKQKKLTNIIIIIDIMIWWGKLNNRFNVKLLDKKKFKQIKRKFKKIIWIAKILMIIRKSVHLMQKFSLNLKKNIEKKILQKVFRETNLLSYIIKPRSLFINYAISKFNWKNN